MNTQNTKTHTPEMEITTSQQHSAGEEKNNKIEDKNNNNNIITKGLKANTPIIYIMCKVGDSVKFRHRETGAIGEGKITKKTDSKFKIELTKNYGTAFGPTGFKSSNKTSSQTPREKFMDVYHQNVWKTNSPMPPFWKRASTGIKKKGGSKKKKKVQPILQDWIQSIHLPNSNLTDKDITPENFKFVKDFINLVESSIGKSKEELFDDPTKEFEEKMNCEEFLQERYENGEHSVVDMFSYREECIQKIWNNRADKLKKKAIKEQEEKDKQRKEKDEFMRKQMELLSKQYDEKLKNNKPESSGDEASAEEKEDGVSDTEVEEAPTPPPSPPAKKKVINSIAKVRKQYAKYVAKEEHSKENSKKYPAKKDMLIAIFKAKKYLKANPGSGDVSD